MECEGKRSGARGGWREMECEGKSSRDLEQEGAGGRWNVRGRALEIWSRRERECERTRAEDNSSTPELYVHPQSPPMSLTYQ